MSAKNEESSNKQKTEANQQVNPTDRMFFDEIVPDPEVADEIRSDLESYLEKIDFTPMSFRKGQIVTGRVVKKKKGEMLIDLGGRAEGIVAGKETKIDGEEEMPEVGDEVLVYVVNPENDKGQIELSIRRTGEAKKWHKLFTAQRNGDIVEVEVIEANTGGVLVTVESGLRGFIPTSQLDAARIAQTGQSTGRDVSFEMQKRLAQLIGDKIKTKIIEIDRDKNRIILSEKLVTNAQDIEKRAETLKQAKVGDVLEAVVTGVTPYGLFVNAEGLDGLVHLSEISWDKVNHPGDFFQIGEKVKVSIIGIQDDGKRVAYSIKRLQTDPWTQAISAYSVGQVVRGTVQKIVDYGAFVRIAEGLNGLVHISELSDQLVEHPSDVVKEGQEVDLQILSISPTERHLGLSLKRVKTSAE